MKKIILLLAVTMLLFTGCSPQPEETLKEYMIEFSIISDDLTLGSAGGGKEGAIKELKIQHATVIDLRARLEKSGFDDLLEVVRLYEDGLLYTMLSLGPNSKPEYTDIMIDSMEKSMDKWIEIGGDRYNSGYGNDILK